MVVQKLTPKLFLKYLNFEKPCRNNDYDAHSVDWQSDSEYISLIF